MYLKGFDSSFEEVNLTDEEIKTAFFCLKGGKSPGFHEINYDIVKQKFNSLLASLKCIFDLSLKSFFFSIWVFFLLLSRSTRRQGKGEAIYLTPHYHFHPLHKYLDITQVITAGSSPLHIARSWTQTENL